MAEPTDPNIFPSDLSAGGPQSNKAFSAKSTHPLDQNPILPDPNNPGQNLYDSKLRSVTLPQPGAGLPPLASSEAIVNAFNDLKENGQGRAINPMSMAKSFEYGAEDFNFERYYNSAPFKKLGFSPLRDNEALYNENMSWIDDMSRAAGQWGNLLSLGLRDAFGFGDLTDTSNAREYERAMNIGSSSKGGLSGFGTNLFLNSGYTFGIMGEMLLEEVGLAAVTAATGGLTAEFTLPAMATRGARAFSKIGNAFKAGKNLTKTITNLGDINKARTYFNKAVNATGRFINPLENTKDFLQGVNRVEDFAHLGDYAKAAHGFAAFYRDIRNIRLAYGESGLEGGMVRNEVEQTLLDEHMRMHGRPPTKEEATEIRTIAAQAGYSTAYQNLPAIFFSNKLVFDNMLKSFNPVRRLAEQSIEKGLGGSLMFNKKAEAFEVIENNFKGWLKTAKNPRAYANVGLNYFKANIAEGLQETTQEVIAGTNIDYYTNKFKGTGLKGGYWAHVADNLQKQVSGEGLEIFMSGFLMGGLVQPVQKAFFGSEGTPSYLKQTYSKFKDPENYEAEVARSKEELNRMANDLNELYKDPLKYFNSDLENLQAQDEYEKAAKQASEEGDAKAYHDIKDASFFEGVHTAMKTGRIDTFIQRMKDMKGYTEEEIKRSPYGANMTKEQFDAKIDKSIQRAYDLQAKYETIEKKYSNPFNPRAKGMTTRERIESAHNYVAWEDAKKEMLFNGHAFERNLERMMNIYNEAANDLNLKNTPNSDFNILFKTNTILGEISLLKQEIEALNVEGLSKDQVKQRKFKEKKLELLEKFQAAYEEFLVADPVSEEQDTGTVKKTGQPFANADLESDTPIASKKLYNAFADYMRHVAKANDDYVFDANLEKAFQKMVDHIMLDSENADLVRLTNILMDPKSFMQRARRLSEMRKQEHEKRNLTIENALNEWKSMVDDNRLFQLLADIGVYFDPAEYEALKEEGKLPTTFYYISEQKGGTGINRTVEKTSEDYREARRIIRSFYTHIKDVPIPERESNKGEYDSRHRAKFENDQRTYADLAEQYGFNPNVESSSVPLMDVLDAIINSPYATAPEKALARRLKETTSPEDTVEFRDDMSSPGKFKYQYTKEAGLTEGQIQVDARYSSANYENANIPIEFVILHETMHKVTVEALKTDERFNTDITNLMESVKAFMESPENAERFPLLPYGMKNQKEFVAEVMTNPEFQKILAEIPSSMDTTRSAWEEFVNKVMAMMRRLFNRNDDGTALNAAFDLVTAKIDDIYGAPIEPTPVNEEVKKIEAERKKELAPLEEEVNDIKKQLAGPEAAPELPEGFRYVEEGEIIPAGDYTTRLSVDGKRSITNAPAPVAEPQAGVKPDVILPIGTSGSGKSTFIKSLPQENLVVISPDEMRKEFTGDINDKSKDAEIYEEAAKRAIEALKEGKQVVFDTTNLTKEKRRPFIEAIKEAMPDANIQYKLMPLDPELAKQRIKDQLERGEDRAAVSDETIDRHAASYAQMLEDIKEEDITEYKDITQPTAEEPAGLTTEERDALNARLDNLNERIKKINQKYDKKITKARGKARPADKGLVKLKPTTPYATLEEHPDLLADLVAAFKKYNQQLVDEGLPPILDGFNTMTDDEIMQSRIFRNTFIRANSRANAVIEQYNQDTGRTQEPVKKAAGKVVSRTKDSVNDVEWSKFIDTNEISDERVNILANKIKDGKALSVRERSMFTEHSDRIEARIQEIKEGRENVPEQWTRALKRQVLDLGYTEEERKEMTVPYAWGLVQEGLTKTQRQDMEAAAERAADQEKEELRLWVLNELTSLINSATTMEELDAQRQGAYDMFFPAQDPEGAAHELRKAGEITTDLIEELVAEKADELAEFTFEDIQVGEVVIMNNQYNTKAIVTRKTDKTLFLEPIKQPTTGGPITYRVSEAKVKERIKYRWNMGQERLDDVEGPEPITDNDQDLANESTENVFNPENVTAAQEAYDEATPESEADHISNLFDEINKCDQ